MIRILISVCISVVMISPQLSGQKMLNDGNWEAVILYNRLPYVVHLTPEGKILDFVQELPNNFEAVNDYIQKEYKSVQASPAVAELQNETMEAMEEIAEFEKEATQTESEEILSLTNTDLASEPEASEEMVEDALPEASVEELESPSIKEREEYRYTLVYPGQVAIFNQGQLSRLNEISKVLLANDQLKLSMYAFASDDGDVSTLVSTNRLEGIKDYLEVKGISANRIQNDGIKLDREKSNTIQIILF